MYCFTIFTCLWWNALLYYLCHYFVNGWIKFPYTYTPYKFIFHSYLMPPILFIKLWRLWDYYLGLQWNSGIYNGVIVFVMFLALWTRFGVGNYHRFYSGPLKAFKKSFNVVIGICNNLVGFMMHHKLLISQNFNRIYVKIIK
jgi:hypothetical protein